MNSVFFNEIITLTNEAFLELFYSGYLQISMPRPGAIWYIACINTVAVILGLLTSIIYVIAQKKEKLALPDYEEKYGTLY